LLRLYFDGDDTIAWHTDGRKFLSPNPNIASLSFGGTADFQLRRMTNVWPSVCGAKDASAMNDNALTDRDDKENGGGGRGGGCDNGVDLSTPQQSVVVRCGDLMLMFGDMQDHWHHRVPPAKGGRMPRVNINFRYIEKPTECCDEEAREKAEKVGRDGQETYYKVRGKDYIGGVSGLARVLRSLTK
jgi:hypothetical protein